VLFVCFTAYKGCQYKAPERVEPPVYDNFTTDVPSSHEYHINRQQESMNKCIIVQERHYTITH
jgi:hypothetical protein